MLRWVEDTQDGNPREHPAHLWIITIWRWVFHSDGIIEYARPQLRRQSSQEREWWLIQRARSQKNRILAVQCAELSPRSRNSPSRYQARARAYWRALSDQTLWVWVRHRLLWQSPRENFLAWQTDIGDEWRCEAGDSCDLSTVDRWESAKKLWPWWSHEQPFSLEFRGKTLHNAGT